MLTLKPSSVCPLQALVYWLSAARAVLVSWVSPALVSMLLLPLAPAKGQQRSHKGSQSRTGASGPGYEVGGSRGMGRSVD